MKRIWAGFLLMCAASLAHATMITLDADTPATGSNLDVSPLVTTEGTITFSGEITNLTDPEFTAAGASGNNFDILGNGALLSFDFDVSSFTFIYGGNTGEFDIVARDILNNPVDSFFQASTDDGEPAGPETLSGTGIRSIFWNDTQGVFAPIDNITITTSSTPVPGPMTILLFALGLAGIGLSKMTRKP